MSSGLSQMVLQQASNWGEERGDRGGKAFYGFGTCGRTGESLISFTWMAPFAAYVNEDAAKKIHSVRLRCYYILNDYYFFWQLAPGTWANPHSRLTHASIYHLELKDSDIQLFKEKKREKKRKKNGGKNQIVSACLMPIHAYTHFNFWRDLLAAHNNYASLTSSGSS